MWQPSGTVGVVMLPNAHPSHSSAPVIEDRATEFDGITLPAEITEHPAWKAIWRKLLTPRTDQPENDEVAA